ncbi:MAG: alpha-D-ribose 1-methylphosphonate 5-triphosphate diphosphatase [Roseiarcus sp.]|jgi:alpha-D-ribose 1-methylphosphonate 5-triphosphate diphosphatase
MEFRDNDPTVFNNATVVTAERAFRGHVVVEGGRIVEIGEGRGSQTGVDCGGDYLLPGLVELHTDHLEAHYMPRPRVVWHAGSAVMAYDAQIVTAGITTVFDSFRVGMDSYEERGGVGEQVVVLADTIEQARAADLLRADHQTHLRCEIPSPNVVEFLEEFLRVHPARLISLMDHTPGQRQFRDIEKYFIYYRGKTGKSEAHLNEVVRERQRVGRERAEANRPRVVAIAKAYGLTLASHDDTTLEDVALAQREGVAIAEFPTTLEAAAASHEAGMATVMGAPNVVRGGSHSGNASARDFAEAGLLDILSSDYVPAALLMGAFRLADAPNIGGLPGAIRLVTKNPAEAAGLTDRGEIAVGRRADLVRACAHQGEPVVRAVWRAGRRVA